MMDCLSPVPVIVAVVTVIVPAVPVPVIAVSPIMVPVVKTYVPVAGIITIVAATGANHHIDPTPVVPIVITGGRRGRAGRFVYHRRLPYRNPDAA